MRKILIVIDMQNDFIDAALGTKEAVAIVEAVKEKIRSYPAENIIATMDTHGENYMETQEGKNLPVPHCIRDTEGWQIRAELQQAGAEVVDKPTFGSRALAEKLVEMNREEAIESITLIGLCTDICVISNAFVIKAFLPETPIIVDAACCAGVTPKSHERALEAMKVCQIAVV